MALTNSTRSHMHSSSIRSVALENLPAPTSHNATLAASLDPAGAPAPLQSLPLSLKFHEKLPYDSNLTSSSSAITPSLTSNSDIALSLRHRAVPPTSFMSSCIPLPSSRALLHITLFTLCFLGVAASRPTQNITIEVPYGTTNHGNLDSLCIPPTSIDIASFLLFNYFAHGATVVSYPGEPVLFTVITVLAAILFPTTGVKRALNLIFRHPIMTAKNDLDVAARSGALCMLVRSSTWKPQQGDDIRNVVIDDPGDEPLLPSGNTSRSDPSTNILPTYVSTYSYSRPTKLTNAFSLISKHCHLVDLQATVAQ